MRDDPSRFLELERLDEDTIRGLTLDAVFRQALAVAGPDRLLFGTDSSFFPRGWQQPIHDAQVAAPRGDRRRRQVGEKMFGSNFNSLFAE